MPRRKELHYFTRSLKYPSSSHLADHSFIKRLIGLSEHNLRFKRELFKAFGHDLLHRDIGQFKWDLNYFLGSYSDDWYLSLFDRQGDIITGEITPAYSLLDDEDLNNLALLLPDIKLIFIMRNPVERAWSTIRYHEKRENKKLTQLPDDQIVDYLSQDAITSRSDYIGILDRWTRHFPQEQFFLCFYDEIIEDPKSLLFRLCEFLGIKDIPLNQSDAKRRVNASFETEMPQSIRELIYKTYHDQIISLSERFDYAERWIIK